MPKEKIIAYLIGESISSNLKLAIDLASKSNLGEFKKNKVIYSFSESLYLVEEKRMEVFYGNKKLDFNSLLKKLKRIDKDIILKYSVFKDLRDKGYIVKTALKFGSEFRVYEKGVKPGKGHAKWIVYPISQNSKLDLKDFSAKSRIANSTKKLLLLGIVDSDGDVSYYEVKWLKA